MHPYGLEAIELHINTTMGMKLLCLKGFRF